MVHRFQGAWDEVPVRGGVLAVRALTTLPSHNPFPSAQDHITLEDYEIKDGAGLELYYN